MTVLAIGTHQEEVTLADWASLVLKDGDKRWKTAGRSPKTDKTPEKRRNKVLAALDNTIKQLKANEESPPRGWYTTKLDNATNTLLVRGTVRLGSRPIYLQKIRADHFVVTGMQEALRAYDGIRADVASGDMDKQIAATLEKKAK